MPVRLGAPVWYSSDDPEEMARAHVALGYGAAYCPDLSLDDLPRVRAVREAFEREGVAIAEVGAWRNMMAPGESERKRNLEYVCQRMALADEVGALCCVNISGSFNPEQWDGPHPENTSQQGFDLTVQNVRHVLDTVRPRRAKFALEMMPWGLPDSPDSFLALLRAVDRPAFAVHLDPVNLVHSPPRYFANGALIQECISKLGPWIVSAHGKDILLSNRLTTHLDEVRPGLGNLDYVTYIRGLDGLPADVPLMLEHLSSPEEYAEATAYVRSMAERAGVTFV